MKKSISLVLSFMLLISMMTMGSIPVLAEVTKLPADWNQTDWDYTVVGDSGLYQSASPTDGNHTYFAVGDFNLFDPAWTPNEAKYQMTKGTDGIYSVTIPVKTYMWDKSFEYKVAQDGTWFIAFNDEGSYSDGSPNAMGYIDEYTKEVIITFDPKTLKAGFKCILGEKSTEKPTQVPTEQPTGTNVNNTIYFDASGPLAGAQRNTYYCYMWGSDGSGHIGEWNTKELKMTKVEGQDNLFSYDVPRTNKNGDVVNADLVIFSALGKGQTYDTTFSESCFGDTAYVTDEVLENPVDSAQTCLACAWRNNPQEGVHISITSTGKVQGVGLLSTETPESIADDFIARYKDGMEGGRAGYDNPNLITDTARKYYISEIKKIRSNIPEKPTQVPTEKPTQVPTEKPTQKPAQTTTRIQGHPLPDGVNLPAKDNYPDSTYKGWDGYYNVYYFEAPEEWITEHKDAKESGWDIGFYWFTGTINNGDWPGIKATKLKGIDNIYYAFAPTFAKNIIWNNGISDKVDENRKFRLQTADVNVYDPALNTLADIIYEDTDGAINGVSVAGCLAYVSSVEKTVNGLTGEEMDVYNVGWKFFNPRTGETTKTAFKDADGNYVTVSGEKYGYKKLAVNPYFDMSYEEPTEAPTEDPTNIRGRIYFDSTGMSEYNKTFYCHLWESDGRGLYSWQTKKERMTAVSGKDNQYYYDIPLTIPTEQSTAPTEQSTTQTERPTYPVTGPAGSYLSYPTLSTSPIDSPQTVTSHTQENSDSFKADLLIISSNTQWMCYETTLSDSCMSDTLYVASGEHFENPDDSSRSFSVCKWKKNTDEGPHINITTTGKVQGIGLLENETPESIAEEFIRKYSNNDYYYYGNIDRSLLTEEAKQGYIQKIKEIIAPRYIKNMEYSISDNKVTITKYNGKDSYVVVPSTIKGCPVTSIGKNAFRECTNLEDISLSDNITEIGENAFRECTNLKNISLSNITEIGNGAFVQCRNLKKITFSENLQTINNNVFYGCKNLKTVSIPKTVTSIGSNAFYNCSNVRDICISGVLTTVGKNAFSGCSLLSEVHLKDNMTLTLWNNIDMNSGNDYLKNAIVIPIEFKYGFLDGQAVIAKYEGKDKNVTVPSVIEGVPVTRIYYEAFKDCSNLRSVVIPDSVTDIGYSAFSNCQRLTNVTLSKHMVFFDKGAFQNCRSLTKITIPGSVKNIGANAFYNCSSLTSIEIPNSVTSIGNEAFSYCNSLTSVIIGKSVTSIGSSAFYYCSSLTSVEIPNSVTSIGNKAFSGCSSLTSINVDSNNSNYNSIDGVLFNQNKTELICYPASNKNRSYTIPNSVTSIGSSAFYYCSSLTSVTILNSVTSIGYGAFYGCSSLTSVEIPDSVTSIGSSAFRYCSSLTSVTIPNSVISIGYEAFEYNSDNGFIIKGTKGSVAESYANENGFTFVDISTITIIEVTGISLSKTALTLEKGKQKTLTATVTPTDATDKTVKWSTSNSSVAVVNSNGKITAKAVGTATITATTTNGKKATCKITVTEPVIEVESISLNKNALSMSTGSTADLTATVTPTNATDKTVTWKSSDTSIATVSNGKVTAKSVGTATITAKTSNGKTAACKITVVEEPTSISINKSSLIVGIGETFKFSCKTNTGTSAKVTYTSSKTSVVTVDSKGNMKAKSMGTAIITATTDNGKTAKCRVTVKNAPTSISINRKNSIMGLGETFYLEGSLANDEASRVLTFSSNKPEVATVTEGGIVTAKSIGTAIVSITTYNGQKATCRVTVRNAPTSLQFNKTSITLKQGETFYLESKFNTGEYARTVIYNSPNKAVATISGSGVIMAKSKGTVKITGKTYNGKTQTCTVTVK